MDYGKFKFFPEYSPCNNEGAVRLIDAMADSVSRVEVCHDGRYGTVCNDYATNAVASVICRELGFAASGMQC